MSSGRRDEAQRLLASVLIWQAGAQNCVGGQELCALDPLVQPTVEPVDRPPDRARVLVALPGEFGAHEQREPAPPAEIDHPGVVEPRPSQEPLPVRVRRRSAPDVRAP
jgi:hypothetical protein